jgi:hypothetical protein
VLDVLPHPLVRVELRGVGRQPVEPQRSVGGVDERSTALARWAGWWSTMQNTGSLPVCSASWVSRWRKAMHPAAVSVPVRIENRRAACALIAEIMFRPNRTPVAATCGVRPTGPVKSSVSGGSRPVMGAGQRGMRSGNWRAKALSAAVQPWVPGFLGSTRLECAPFL